EPELLEVARRLLGQLLIGHGQKIRQRLEHHHLGAQAAPHAAELETYYPGADYAEALGNGVEFQSPPGIDDVRGAERGRTQLDGRGTRGEHDLLCGELALRAVVTSKRHAAVPEQLAVTLEGGHAARLEQRENSLRHGLDYAGFALLHLRNIEGH